VLALGARLSALSPDPATATTPKPQIPVGIDADGLILAVDGQWPMVGMTYQAVSVGSSYYSLLAKICAGKPARAAAVTEGIRAVSDGAADTFIIATNIDLRADSPYRLPSGRYVMLEVSDTGAGMDPETLTDIIMPGPNRRDLAERAVAWKPGLKVIYMSGYTDDVLINAGTRGPDVLFLASRFSWTARRRSFAKYSTPPRLSLSKCRTHSDNLQFTDITHSQLSRR
jgi:hypothetical protein